MNIRPEELEQQGYTLMDSLDHLELVPFIQTYMNKKARFSRLYTLSNVLVIIFLAVLYYVHYSMRGGSFGDAFGHLGYGLALAFLLVPIHEYIHALAYRAQGAVNTSYDVNWKKFYFMAIADKFVANKKEFFVVALAPFSVISLTLLLLFFMVGPLWQFTVLGTLLTHTAFCSGDFGLLSYFDFHKDIDVATYDDKTNRISYFYGKAK